MTRRLACPLVDASIFYAGHKDVNALLMARQGAPTPTVGAIAMSGTPLHGASCRRRCARAVHLPGPDHRHEFCAAPGARGGGARITREVDG